jgi:hypothetical protein
MCFGSRNKGAAAAKELHGAGPTQTSSSPSSSPPVPAEHHQAAMRVAVQAGQQAGYEQGKRTGYQEGMAAARAAYSSPPAVSQEYLAPGGSAPPASTLQALADGQEAYVKSLKEYVARLHESSASSAVVVKKAREAFKSLETTPQEERDEEFVVVQRMVKTALQKSQGFFQIYERELTIRSQSLITAEMNLAALRQAASGAAIGNVDPEKSRLMLSKMNDEHRAFMASQKAQLDVEEAMERNKKDEEAIAKELDDIRTKKAMGM